MIKSLSLKLINWYQKKGGSQRVFLTSCNFYPTCSEYTRLAIEKYGALRGWFMGFKRIHRCTKRDSTCIADDPLV
ncbi:MAG: alpha-hemolysin [Porticoccaceae bacterium]|nr:alpha-hemolysin [Porticoccaceae bacterium]